MKSPPPERQLNYGLRHPRDYEVHIEGVRLLTKLRLKFSVLNEHKFRHNFRSLTPLCACGNDMEDNEHFLLRCPQFDVMRQDLFGRLSEIPGLNIDLDDKPLCDFCSETQRKVSSSIE